MHSFSNLIESALAFKNEFGFNQENIFYHNLPMTYMAGILNLFVMRCYALSIFSYLFGP